MENTKPSNNGGIELSNKEDLGAEDIDDTEPVEVTVNPIVSKETPNTYAAKKTVAQGMMDIALITANANQLRYVLDFGDHNTAFFIIIVLIAISLMLQVAVGVCLIFKGKFDMRGDSKHRHANKLNNYVVMGVFLVTVINVFVATFTITPKKNPEIESTEQKQ